MSAQAIRMLVSIRGEHCKATGELVEVGNDYLIFRYAHPAYDTREHHFGEATELDIVITGDVHQLCIKGIPCTVVHTMDESSDSESKWKVKRCLVDTYGVSRDVVRRLAGLSGASRVRVAWS